MTVWRVLAWGIGIGLLAILASALRADAAGLTLPTASAAPSAKPWLAPLCLCGIVLALWLDWFRHSRTRR